MKDKMKPSTQLALLKAAKAVQAQSTKAVRMPLLAAYKQNASKAPQPA